MRLANCKVATTHLERYKCVAARVVESFSWLSWLRSSETFDITRKDVEIIIPHDHDTYDLPHDTGAVLVKLLPSKKSSHMK
jgi:hypothetical protein